MQEAFRENHALQCGFCTPGMVMSAIDMVKRHNYQLDEATVRRELEGNLCRCTGYHNIVKAILAAAPAMKSAGVYAMTAATGIGARVLRTEDKRFLTGTGRYVDDLPLARATYAYFLRSPHAHAKIKSIDTSAAKAMPGVVAIFTGKDIADAKVGGLICGWVVKDKHGQPHKAPPHPVMARRHRALCRRHGRHGRGQQPRRGQGRRRGDQGRLRA